MPKQIPKLSSSRIIIKEHTPIFEDIKNGIMLLVDKPFEWTSFDVVNKIRATLKHSAGIKKIKVGHAGTLDPMATGLLLVCVGKYTKLIDGLTGHTKTYEAEFKLGCTTPSYDQESDEENHQSIDHIKKEDLIHCADQFIGAQLQMPPIYSAIKINGESAHRLARRGKDVQMKKREIVIYNFNFETFNKPHVSFNIHCSKGTYIRSLAHDFGQHLGCGAYLSGLRRTKVEQYDISQSLSIEEVIDYIKNLPVQIID